jgi:type VI secretion system protein ImpJ
MSLLRSAVASRVVTVKLDAREDGMHLAKLADEELLKVGVRFVLAVEAKVPESTSYELVPRIAKVGSWGQIIRFLHSATPGVPLSSQQRPPREVPVRPGRCYFSLAIDHDHFHSLLRERTVAVHLPPPFDPGATQLELIAIPCE